MRKWGNRMKGNLIRGRHPLEGLKMERKWTIPLSFSEGISCHFRTGWTWRREAEDGTLPESDLLIDSMARCKS